MAPSVTTTTAAATNAPDAAGGGGLAGDDARDVDAGEEYDGDDDRGTAPAKDAPLAVPDREAVAALSAALAFRRFESFRFGDGGDDDGGGGDAAASSSSSPNLSSPSPSFDPMEDSLRRLSSLLNGGSLGGLNGKHPLGMRRRRASLETIFSEAGSFRGSLSSSGRSGCRGLELPHLTSSLERHAETMDEISMDSDDLHMSESDGQGHGGSMTISQLEGKKSSRWRLRPNATDESDDDDGGGDDAHDESVEMSNSARARGGFVNSMQRIFDGSHNSRGRRTRATSPNDSSLNFSHSSFASSTSRIRRRRSDESANNYRNWKKKFSFAPAPSRGSGGRGRDNGNDNSHDDSLSWREKLEIRVEEKRNAGNATNDNRDRKRDRNERGGNDSSNNSNDDGRRTRIYHVEFNSSHASANWKYGNRYDQYRGNDSKNNSINDSQDSSITNNWREDSSNHSVRLRPSLSSPRRRTHSNNSNNDGRWTRASHAEFNSSHASANRKYNNQYTQYRGDDSNNNSINDSHDSSITNNWRDNSSNLSGCLKHPSSSPRGRTRRDRRPYGTGFHTKPMEKRSARVSWKIDDEDGELNFVANGRPPPFVNTAPTDSGSQNSTRETPYPTPWNRRRRKSRSVVGEGEATRPMRSSSIISEGTAASIDIDALLAGEAAPPAAADAKARGGEEVSELLAADEELLMSMIKLATDMTDLAEETSATTEELAASSSSWGMHHDVSAASGLNASGGKSSPRNAKREGGRSAADRSDASPRWRRTRSSESLTVGEVDFDGGNDRSALVISNRAVDRIAGGDGSDTQVDFHGDNDRSTIVVSNRAADRIVGGDGPAHARVVADAESDNGPWSPPADGREESAPSPKSSMSNETASLRANVLPTGDDGTLSSAAEEIEDSALPPQNSNPDKAPGQDANIPSAADDEGGGQGAVPNAPMNPEDIRELVRRTSRTSAAITRLATQEVEDYRARLRRKRAAMQNERVHNSDTDANYDAARGRTETAAPASPEESRELNEMLLENATNISNAVLLQRALYTLRINNNNVNLHHQGGRDCVSGAGAGGGDNATRGSNEFASSNADQGGASFIQRAHSEHTGLDRMALNHFLTISSSVSNGGRISDPANSNDNGDANAENAPSANADWNANTTGNPSRSLTSAPLWSGTANPFAALANHRRNTYQEGRRATIDSDTSAPPQIGAVQSNEPAPLLNERMYSSAGRNRRERRAEARRHTLLMLERERRQSAFAQSSSSIAEESTSDDGRGRSGTLRRRSSTGSLMVNEVNFDEGDRGANPGGGGRSARGIAIRDSFGFETDDATTASASTTVISRDVASPPGDDGADSAEAGVPLDAECAHRPGRGPPDADADRAGSNPAARRGDGRPTLVRSNAHGSGLADGSAAASSRQAQHGLRDLLRASVRHQSFRNTFASSRLLQAILVSDEIVEASHVETIPHGDYPSNATIPSGDDGEYEEDEDDVEFGNSDGSIVHRLAAMEELLEEQEEEQRQLLEKYRRRERVFTMMMVLSAVTIITLIVIMAL